MKNIGIRLEAALEILKNESPKKLFADIGSDHAFLAIEAKKRGYADKVIASDINPLPLEKGRINASLQNIESDFILSDGFGSIDELGIDAAAVCGMGGELIADIIARSKTAKECLLILQPMSAQEVLRAYLWENGFDITKEVFVCENKKPYTVMSVKYTGVNTEFSYSDTYLGKERPRTEEFSRYAEKVMLRASKRRKGELATGKDTSDTDLLISECQMHLTSFSAGQ